MTNSVDPDQMPHYAASDLDLHCFQSLICASTWGYYGTHNMFLLENEKNIRGHVKEAYLVIILG